MDKRWQVSEDGTTWSRDVTVKNGAKVTITEDQDLDAGQIFKRKKLSTKLLFGGADYLYFLNFERSSMRRCRSIYIRCQFKCAQNWSTFWTGEFSTGSGTWDLDKCLFEVQPETVDRFQCLLKKQDVKRNLLTAPKVTVTIPTIASWEYTLLTTISGNPVPVGSGDEILGPGGAVPDTPINGWDYTGDSLSGVSGGTVVFFWRERVETECVGGSPAPPPGSGWVLISNDCATTGTALYARPPVVAWPFDTPTIGTIVDGENAPPDSSCQWVYIGNGGVDDPFTTESETLPYYVCMDSAEAVEVDTARTLKEAAEVIIEATGCDLAGIRSDLFNWNPVGDAPGYVAGIDYVTGLPAQRDNLLIAQKSDVIDPDATNPATIGEWTFKELMQLFLALECFWTIDNQGYVRVEHWTYWASQVGLTVANLRKASEPLIYEHLSAETPNVERLTFMEALSRDFVGKDIEYDGPCAQQSSGNAKEYSPGKVTTDVGYILTSPGDISKDGFVVLATRVTDSGYSTIISQGAITGDYLSNAPMSTANIENDYWRDRRYLKSGRMNGVETDFNIRPNIEQSDVKASMCCELLQYDPSDTLVTVLGARLGGLPAYVDSVTYDLFVDQATWTLRYAY